MAPASSAACRTISTSAGVSVENELTATTTLTPYFRAFLIWRAILGKTFAQQVEVFVRIFGSERFSCHHLRSTAVHLEGADRCDQHHHLRDQTRVAALDIEEFLHANIRTETRTR